MRPQLCGNEWPTSPPRWTKWCSGSWRKSTESVRPGTCGGYLTRELVRERLGNAEHHLLSGEVDIAFAKLRVLHEEAIATYGCSHEVVAEVERAPEKVGGSAV